MQDRTKEFEYLLSLLKLLELVPKPSSEKNENSFQCIRSYCLKFPTDYFFQLINFICDLLF